MLFLAHPVQLFIKQPLLNKFMGLCAMTTSSHPLPIETIQRRETEKDFKKIARLLARNPPPKMRQRKGADENSGKEDEMPEGSQQQDMKLHIHKCLHEEYNEHAEKQRLERWKAMNRQKAFCFIRDRNTRGLISYLEDYLERQRRDTNLILDEELFEVASKFMSKEFAYNDHKEYGLVRSEWERILELKNAWNERSGTLNSYSKNRRIKEPRKWIDYSKNVERQPEHGLSTKMEEELLDVNEEDEFDRELDKFDQEQQEDT